VKNNNFLHFIFKNFSCVDYYENLLLNGTLNCVLVVTDLNLLNHSSKINKFRKNIFVPYPLGKSILYLAESNNIIAKIILKFYIKLFKNSLLEKKIKKVIKEYNPNGIFIDQRFIPETKSNKRLNLLLNKLNLKKFSIPHAPHYRNANSMVSTKIHNVTYISNTKDVIRENNVPIEYIGYPNFGNKSLGIKYSKNSKKIILLFRYFDREDDDLCDYSNDIEFILVNIPKGFELVINPHPSLDKLKLKNILRNSKIENYNIADEIPSDEYLLCISTFTTAILNLVSYEIPLMILNTSSFQFMRKWQFVDGIYSKLNGFCENNEIFLDSIRNLDFFIANYDTKHNLKILENNFPKDASNNFLTLIE